MRESDPDQIRERVLKGKNFRITFKEMTNTLPLNICIKNDKKLICPNIVIHAIDEQKAFDVLSLVAGCLQVIGGGGQLWSLEDIDYKELGNNKNKATFDSLCSSGVYRACVVATKVSYRLSYKYAIYKLNHSYEIFSLPFMEYDPFHSAILPKTTFLRDYVKFANAIVLAYSAIEELELEVRVNEEHPHSRIKGEWDEFNKSNLEGRLRRKHVHLSEKVVWLLRGKERFLDQKFRSKGQSASWNKSLVRDKILNVMDAICEASFLRSRVSSHANSPKKRDKRKLIKCLTPYDVNNVQFLARYLLLSNLGFLPSS